MVVLGTPTSAQSALESFRHLWWYVAATAVASALASSTIRRDAVINVESGEPNLDAAEARTMEAVLDGELVLPDHGVLHERLAVSEDE